VVKGRYRIMYHAKAIHQNDSTHGYHDNQDKQERQKRKHRKQNGATNKSENH
jgi:hypothetical protein